MKAETKSAANKQTIERRQYLEERCNRSIMSNVIS